MRGSSSNNELLVSRSVSVYLRTVKWDGNSRIRSWLHDYMGADLTEYTTMIGTEWLLALAERALNPGSYCSLPIIFCASEMGTCHAALLALVPARDWVLNARTMPKRYKRPLEIQPTFGKWLVVLNLGRDDSPKGILSRDWKHEFTTCRDSYWKGGAYREFGRQHMCAVVACEEMYASLGLENKYSRNGFNWWYRPLRLTDAQCARISAEKLSADRDQLWAEAVHLIDSGITARKFNCDHLELSKQALLGL